jgi:hypothetical protein
MATEFDVTIVPPAELAVTVQPAAGSTVTVSVGQGPSGPPGPVASQFTHTQAVAADEWIVNHNLGFRPNVAVTTLGGVVVIAEVLHISINQARVYFDTVQTGLALCS